MSPLWPGEGRIGCGGCFAHVNMPTAAGGSVYVSLGADQAWVLDPLQEHSLSQCSCSESHLKPHWGSG